MRLYTSRACSMHSKLAPYQHHRPTREAADRKINYAACTLGEVPSRSDITQVSQESERKDQNQSALSAGYSGLQIYDKAVIRPVEYDECSCNRPHSVQTVSFRLAFLHGRLLERLLTQSRFPVLAPTAVQSR